MCKLSVILKTKIKLESFGSPLPRLLPSQSQVDVVDGMLLGSGKTNVSRNLSETSVILMLLNGKK